jgi:hypothetical protein
MFAPEFQRFELYPVRIPAKSPVQQVVRPRLARIPSESAHPLGKNLRLGGIGGAAIQMVDALHLTKHRCGACGMI